MQKILFLSLVFLLFSIGCVQTQQPSKPVQLLKDNNFQKFERPYVYSWQDVQYSGSQICFTKKAIKTEPTFAVKNSGSMFPTIVGGETLLIQYAPAKEDVHVGDILYFQIKDRLEPSVHRVIEIGVDQNGWYAITQGDNNFYPDQRIRFEQILGKVVGVLY